MILTNYFAGAILVLLVLLSGLGWAYRAQVSTVATLKAQKAEIQQVNADQVNIINRLRDERDKMETSLADWIKKLDAATQASRARENQLKAELYDLRKSHNEIETFLNIHVPDLFGDWLRTRS